MNNLSIRIYLIKGLYGLIIPIIILTKLPLYSQSGSCSNTWRTVGATGIVDEMAREAIELGRIAPPLITSPQSSSKSTTNYSYEDMSAHLRPNVQPGVYSIRYQLPPVNNGCLCTIVKLSDPALDKITIILKEYDIINPGENAKIIYSFSTEGKYFDNDKYRSLCVPSNIVENISISCNKLYFIEAILETTRPTRATIPSIGTKVIGPSIAAMYLGTCVFD